jgi:hypothetical protein
MAYKYSELEKQALEAIEKHKLFFIADVTSYLPCSMGTFYDFKLQESEAIKEALTKVKTDIKVSMRSKWYKSDNPTLQMGLMKLISTDEELRKLSMQHNANEEIEKPIFKPINLDVRIDNGSV